MVTRAAIGQHCVLLSDRTESRKGGFFSNELSGQSVPCLTVKKAACSLLVDTAPLFEEKGDSSPSALIFNFDHPFFLYWSRPRTRLASNNDPIYVAKVKRGERAE